IPRHGDRLDNQFALRFVTFLHGCGNVSTSTPKRNAVAGGKCNVVAAVKLNRPGGSLNRRHSYKISMQSP
ncbi:MAG TPA: hypothetical protein VJ719_00245, partial [Chthoniobacterales bacterium]|nr:hypothetical protein [Chthoniobacterales bacterium]